jgi:hypothetical protein
MTSSSRKSRQANNITGRDGYLMMQALAYTIVAIGLRPEEYQEWSNREDMKLLLQHHAGNLAQHFLNNAEMHLTGKDHPASHPPAQDSESHISA